MFKLGEKMKKLIFLIITASLCNSLLLFASQNPPHRICCRAVYRAGAALGAAASLSSFFSNKNELINSNLDSASFWIEASNTFCHGIPPVWPNWEDLKQKLDIISYDLTKQETELEQDNARRECGYKLKKYYFEFSEILLYSNYSGTMKYESTCAEKYFKLGFALKYAHIAFGYAVGEGHEGSSRVQAQSEGIEYLERALRILNELPGAVPVWGKCVELWQPSFIKIDIENMLSNEYSTLDLKNMVDDIYNKADDAFDGIPELNIRKCPGTDNVMTTKGLKLIKSANDKD
jgi:hypothetical protein